MPRPDPLCLAACAVAAALVLPGLGAQHLWQDEAQTALIAGTVLDHGIPMGTDGVNYFSQEVGKEYAANHVWRWHTWLSFYVVAASFALIGETAFAARLPFAIFGVLCVALCFSTARALWRDRTSAVAAAGLCAVSVPFLILSRQCRYYTLAALLSLLALRAWASVREGGEEGEGGRGAIWLLFGATFLLFHTHYVYAATLLASLIAYAALFEREKLRAALAVTAAVALVNLPWIVWFSDVRPGGDRYFASVFNFAKLLRFSVKYVGLLDYFLPAWLLLAPLPVVALRWRQSAPLFALDERTARGVALVLVYCGASILLLSALSPLLFYRYLAPLGPPLFVLGGLLLSALLRLSPWLGAAAAAVLVATSSLDDYLAELRSELGGPIEGIVTFLEEHAAPDDVVAISYGDLPVKFHTGLRVVGGLTGEDLSDVKRARWIVLRRHTNTRVDAEVKRALLEELTRSPREFLLHRIDAPDLQFENREDPARHRFRPAPASVPRVVIYERRG